MLRQDQIEWLQSQVKPGNAMSQIIRKIITDKYKQKKISLNLLRLETK